MGIYLSLNAILTTLALIFFGTQKPNWAPQKPTFDILFLGTSFFILWFVSSFRGDFATDFNNYKFLFHIYNQFDFLDSLKAEFDQELGFVLFSRTIGLFTNDFTYLAAASSFLILLLTFSEIKTNSKYAWLSVLIFVNIGNYYASFNLIRQIIAASIIFSASQYLYERKFLKYLLLAIVAALFHKSALAVIPFFFILQCTPKPARLTLTALILLITFLTINDVVTFFQRHLYSVYTEDSYGMNGYSINNAVIPISVLLFVLLHIKLIDLDDKKSRTWVNASIFYAFFSILGLKIQMLERFSYFFSPYACLIIPHLISRLQNNLLRLYYILAIIFLLALYNYISIGNSPYNPYYFTWD